jgi:hypothetical protein
LIVKLGKLGHDFKGQKNWFVIEEKRTYISS